MTSNSRTSTAILASMAALLLFAAPAIADDKHHTSGASATSQPSVTSQPTLVKPGQGQQSQPAMPGMQRQGGMGPGTMMGSGASGQGMPMMAPGMMQMMDSGGMPMMGGGIMMGGGAMGRGMGGQGLVVTPIRHITTDDARHFFEHWIDAHGVKRLKVSEVKEKDDDTISVDIVTVDGSLVQRFAVDRHSGRARPSE